MADVYPVIGATLTPCLSVSVHQNVEKERERRTQLSSEEIRQKVEQYNALTKDHLKMTLVSEHTHTHTYNSS